MLDNSFHKLARALVAVAAVTLFELAYLAGSPLPIGGSGTRAAVSGTTASR